jgi:tRNA (cytidine32/uridine32-2'-O)-methyltransferase
MTMMANVEIPVRIVLVETSHPGNIGAAARAMKTMGLSDLALVAPKEFPSPEADARASGADDILAAARVYVRLEDAIRDRSLVVGASARLRSLPWPTIDPRQCAARVFSGGHAAGAAIVMGPEQSGLTNQQMGLCQLLVNIPTTDFSSLNVAMAVQVICYELRMAALRPAQSAETLREDALATAGELDGFHAHLERVLLDAGFIKNDHPEKLKLRLRRLFQRAALDRTEVNILRGMLAALDPRRKSRES